MEEMEDDCKDSKEENEDEEILSLPEESAIVLDSTATDALDTLQDYYRQKEVENDIYLMVGSLNRKLRNMCLS